MSEALESLGVVCLIAFAYFVWPPLALLPLGLTLLVAGFVLDGVTLRRSNRQ